ncbi:ABC transporter ATP-binding protein [Alteribacillus sp. HJP-4]|uniref:ABC transporter ATP-binding protein n=1 Tax=Alteribacillus sp. HJP-4 TaxID=2775394 RepID=UPI0035CD1675
MIGHEDNTLSEKQQRIILKRLLSYVIPEKKLFMGACVFLFLGTGAELIGPILIKIFIDDYLTEGNFPRGPITGLAFLFIILHLTSVCFNYFQVYWFQRVSLRIIRKLRVEVFKKTEQSTISFFDKTPSGGLISRITNDTETIKELYVEVLSTFLQNLVFLTGILAAMIYLDVRLAVWCFILMPVLYVLMRTYRKASAKFYGAMSGKLSSLNTKLNESIQGMTIIQIFRQQKRMQNEFEEMNQQHFSAWMKSMKIDGLLLRPAVDLLAVIALVGVLFYFGFASLDTSVEIGVLYAFVNYLDRFFEPVNQMMMRLSIYQQAIVSAGRVFRLLDHPDVEKLNEDKPNWSIEDGRIDFEQVSFSYDGSTAVLEDISFSVEKGETLALVGHTGSGKSSIISLLLRFYRPEKGTILVDGKPLEEYKNSEIRRHIGLVLQDPFLFTGTIRENIKMYDASMTDDQMQEAARFVGADAFIINLPDGYDTKIGERGESFSNGERQLITFARTIARKPSILILDEATASIDTESESYIQQALEKMQKGRTTIMIAHRLSTIKEADKILVLNQGRIVERGTHQHLLRKQGLYYNLYLLQQGMGQKKLSGI